MRAEDILSLRIGPEDRAIGYGKGAYVFHMLRVMLGDEVFYNALRDVIANRGFKFTSWEDFRISFEKVSGKDFGEREILDAYFRVASSLEHGSVKNDKEVTEEDLRNHSLYILGGVGERLSHYGKYSYLLFVNGENKEKGVWNVERLRKTF